VLWFMALFSLTRSLRGRWFSTRQTIGLGYVREVSDVSRTHLVRELLASVDHPQRHIPGVENVIVQPATGTAGDDGALWRRMTLNGKCITEHIYCNPAAGLVRRVALEKDGHEGELEIISAVLMKPLRLEMYQRHRDTLERADWPISVQLAEIAFEQVVSLARAKQAQDTDACFHGSKA